MGFTIEHKNSCCGRGLVKGSQEAKDWAKKMADARKAKQVLVKQTEPKVKIEIMGEPQLILPEYFAVPRKNGYKLVNPMTKERNLSKRKGETSVKILRKPVENAILLEGKNELIPLSLFSKKDRELITQHFDKIEQNKNKSVQEKPVIQMPPSKERGRPEKLPKNIEINKERNDGKAKKGRPSKYKSQEEATKAKALKDKERYAKKQEAKKNANQPVEGDGIMEDIGNIIKTGSRKVKNTIKRVSSVAKEVFYGASELPRAVQEILQKYGNEEISSITIMRTPVGKVLTGALSLFSAGKFGERMKENEFDELFHLFLEAKMINGSRIQVEKNERINMLVNPPSRPKTEIEPIVETLPSGFNLNTMMANTERFMGKNKFLGYSARDNNCQDFLSAVLRANNLGDGKDIAFIKQDTKSLFEDLPYLRKLSNTLTDIGAKASAVVSGGGVKDVMKYKQQISNMNERIAEIKRLRQFQFDRGNYGADRQPLKGLNEEENRLEDELLIAEKNLEDAMLGSEKYSVVDKKKNKRGEENIVMRIIDGRGAEQSTPAGASVLSGDMVNEILDYITDEDLTNFFGGLFDNASAINPNQIYRFGNLRFILTADQYARMRGRILALRRRLQNAPKQKGRKKYDGGDGDGEAKKGINLFGKGLTENNIYDNSIMDTRFNPPTNSMADARFFRKPIGGKAGIRQMKGMGHNGCATCPMCGSGIFDDIGKAFKKVGNDIKGGFEKTIIQPAKKTFTPKLGRQITSGLIHKALPAVISGLAGSATTALTGNPYAGFAVGQTAGKLAGKEAGDALGKATGYGVKKPNAWIAMVKKVQQEQGVSYKEAMSIASQMKRKM